MRKIKNLCVDLTALKEGRFLTIDWGRTRRTLIDDWGYYRRNWRAEEERPPPDDFGVGTEPTFRCLCNRVLPVYLAQVDHILSHGQIPSCVRFKRINPPDSPGPIRQILYIDTETDEFSDELITSIRATYLVEFTINTDLPPISRPGAPFLESSFGRGIGRYGVGPQEGIIRASIWDRVALREEVLVFEFSTFTIAPNIYTKIVHAGDDEFETTIRNLLSNDLRNFQLLCGPCNASKGENSFQYYLGRRLNYFFES